MAKILVVDDSRAVRNLIQQRLGGVASEIILAEDGAAALNQARSRRFDLIISDMDMPRMNGLRLCQELGEGSDARPPVLVMVSDFDDSRVEQGFHVGVSGYIPKYNLGEELLPRVNEALRRPVSQALWSALVVDASETVRDFIQRHLRTRGFLVETAASGQEALDRMLSLRPDLLIAEHRMACEDGLSLFEAVSGNATLRSIPYLVLCAEDTRKTAMKLLQQGASSCLTKPFGPDRLVRQAREAMNLARRRQEREADLMGMQFDGVFRGVVEMVRTLESRDPTTNGHSQNVANLSRKIGQVMGIAPEELRRLHLAARLHDIGKVGLPDSILLKPSALTAEEFDLVRQHSRLGAKLLESFSGLSDILPAVLQHHERYDGGGYPSGMRGESIDVYARIIAVADTFDALTGKRPYRDPVDEGAAMKIIREVSGTQLCPECVNALVLLLDREAGQKTTSAQGRKDAAQGEASRKSPVEGRTVVIADQNRLLYKEAAKRLTALGARKVIHAEDGETAWKAMNAEHANLLVCDWNLPGLSCRELLERMAWSEEFGCMGAIITAHDVGQRQISDILAMRPAAILHKPFSFDDFVDRVEEALTIQVRLEDTVEDSPEKSLSDLVHGAMRRSSEMLHRFSTEAVDKYSFRMHRFFTSRKLQAPAGNIRQACDAYDQLVHSEFVGRCEKLLTHIGMATQNDEQAFRESMREFTAETKRLLEGSSGEFLEHFRTHLLDTLFDKAREYADSEHTEWVVEEFRTDIRQSSERLHTDISSMVNSVLDNCGDLTESECKLLLHKLVDAFGRGLMESVNDFYIIEDHVDGKHQRDRSFPRQFCAPVLEVIRNYVIGREKYDKANMNILKSVRKFMGRDSGYEPEKLRIYFTHPKIRQYYVGFLLYCLKKLSSEVRRENFIAKVNSQLPDQGDTGLCFDERAWSMLSHSWAHTVLTNMGDKQRGSKSIMSIISRYLPN